jgi:UDP-glucose 4-epimerase
MPASKVAAEGLMAAWCRAFGLDTVSLRYFNVFGPRQKADSQYAAVIPVFARRLLAGERPVIFGDGQQSRDFTYVANAVLATLLAGSHEGALAGEVINVGGGQAHDASLNSRGRWPRPAWVMRGRQSRASPSTGRLGRAM